MKIRVTLILTTAMLAVLASSASASSVKVRGTGSYGTLSDHQVSAPTITGTGTGILGDTLYQCNYNTPCAVDISGSGCGDVFANPNDLSGPAQCFDLFVTISPNTILPPGSTLSITIPGFTNPTGQFGVFQCDGAFDSNDPNSQQGFHNVCSTSVPPGCQSSLDAQSPSAGGVVNIPSACLAPGETFYFDETSNGTVSASFTTPSSTPEPNSLSLLVLGLMSIGLLAKRSLRA
jgi:hypothetical protein